MKRTSKAHLPISQTVNDTIALYSSPMRRLADLGTDALTEIDALSLLLDASDSTLAGELLAEYGSLTGLARANLANLRRFSRNASAIWPYRTRRNPRAQRRLSSATNPFIWIGRWGNFRSLVFSQNLVSFAGVERNKPPGPPLKPLRILTKLSHNVSPFSLKDHAKAVAAFWTPDGDYAERVLNGRPAIEKDSADLEWLIQTVAAQA